MSDTAAVASGSIDDTESPESSPRGFAARLGALAVDWLPLPVVGVLAGLLGATYLAVLHVLQHWFWPDANTVVVQTALLVGTGVVLGIVAITLGPGGNVELLVDNIHVLGRATHDKGDRALLPLSLLCVSVGGALGPEAPLVQTCGQLGSWVARRTGRPAPAVRVLTITGMAAGFTVLFGAPIGGTVFALEILHRRGLEYYEALVPSLVGGLSGYVVFVGITHLGLRPVWSFTPISHIDLADLGGAVLAGIVGAALAVVFATLVKALRRATVRVPRWLAPVLGGVALAGLAIWSPYALTFGEAQLPELLTPGVLIATLAVALVAKLAASAVCLATGWKGGFIIPLFFCGAAAGQLLARFVTGPSPAVLVVGVMVATVVGVMNTPLGATLVVTEMSGLSLLPTTLVASIVSLMLTRPLTMVDTQRGRTDLPSTDAGMTASTTTGSTTTGPTRVRATDDTTTTEA